MDIASARTEHEKLVMPLMRHPNDFEGAMRRAESMFGLGYWSQWNLRHKRRASEGFVERLRQASLAMAERSVRRSIERLKATQARGSGDDTTQELLLEAENLLSRIAAKKEAR